MLFNIKKENLKTIFGINLKQFFHFLFAAEFGNMTKTLNLRGYLNKGAKRIKLGYLALNYLAFFIGTFNSFPRIFF